MSLSLYLAWTPGCNPMMVGPGPSEIAEDFSKGVGPKE